MRFSLHSVSPMNFGNVLIIEYHDEDAPEPLSPFLWLTAEDVAQACASFPGDRTYFRTAAEAVANAVKWDADHFGVAI